MTPLQAKDEKILKKRLERFLSSRSLGGPDIVQVLEPLQRLGQVLIFGGALRDLALEGNRVAPSDIDVVVRSGSFHELAELMHRHRAVRNRFGGYRFVGGRWKFDVWAFEDTWAFRAGWIAGHRVEDLLKTTFFDWDAIAYDVAAKRLIFRESYFDALADRVVDINLRENPNPRGSALRALRIFQSGKAKLTARLGRYVLDMIPVVGTKNRGIRDLAARLAEAGHLPVGLDSQQLSLTS